MIAANGGYFTTSTGMGANRLSLGFFDAVIWAAADDQGHPRGFDFQYINPIIFLRPVEAQSGSGDNALIGFHVKI